MGAIRYVKIVATPLGEAPEWVRRKWIGLELPVLHHVPITTQACGVVTGGTPTGGGRGWFSMLVDMFRPTMTRGYVAPIDACIAILAEQHPDAADWWRTNTPHLLNREEWWIFDEPACELIPLAPPPVGPSG